MPEFQESLYNGWGQFFAVDEILYERKTEHFELVIFRNREFGRVLALDGVVQTTERDEFIYHEMLTHVPLLAHGAAKRVLIIGGGDGGMLREVCRHSSVEHVTLVEIDPQVVELSKEYLPEHSQGAFDDSRLRLVFQDGLDYVRESPERFDVIISDSTDPIGPGETLFRSEFYEGCHRCLADGGVLVTQNGVAFEQLQEVTTTARRMTKSFRDWTFYAAAVPTYVGGIMMFAWASDEPSLRSIAREVLSERLAESGVTTRYYTPEVHRAAFALPRYVLDAISQAGA